MRKISHRTYESIKLVVVAVVLAASIIYITSYWMVTP